MDTTEDLFAAGWAADLLPGGGPDDRCVHAAEALPQRVLQKLAANVGLARQLAVAERDREAALGTAAREHAENDRLTAEVRWLRHQLTPVTLARIDDALAGPCSCLAAAAPVASRTDAPPKRGRLIRWTRL